MGRGWDQAEFEARPERDLVGPICDIIPPKICGPRKWADPVTARSPKSGSRLICTNTNLKFHRIRRSVKLSKPWRI